MNKLAIVIPYYKIDFFEETLQSVAAQSNRDFVLYIGNDASPDNPLPLIQKYLNSDEYQYFDYKDNLGGKNLALQWERILENVKEEWFQILGDDDVISENFVAEFYKNLPKIQSENISAIKFSHNIVDENKTILHTITTDETIIPAPELFKRKYKGLMPSSLSENIFALSAYKKHHFLKIPFAWGADDYAILTFSGLDSVFYLSDAKVTVRMSTSSISGDLSLQSKKDLGYHIMRENVLNKHSQYFDKSFVIRMLNDHLRFCERNLLKPHLRLFSILMKRGYPKRFLDMTKVVWSINKKIKHSKA
mgnify:FL=1